MVEKGGLTIKTTLDLKIQETAEKIVKEEREVTRLSVLFSSTISIVLIFLPRNNHHVLSFLQEIHKCVCR